jgi:uncharacterized membrane protein YdbT with pleckstrin-like domain/phage FluMu protein Com
MAIIRCDKCDKSFDSGATAAGQKIACPSCGDINIVPAQAAPPPAGKPDRAATAGFPPANGPEVTVLSLRPSMFRARPFLFLLLFLVVVGGLVGVALTWAMPPAAIACGAVSLVAVVWLGVWRILKLGEGMRVTTKRIIDREGFFSKVTSEVLHADIKNVQIRQSFRQRILNVGTIAISSAAENEDEISMNDVPNPEKVKDTIDLYRPL